MHRSKKKRNIVIFSLIGILLCMVVGYAAFQTRLEIKGTSKVTSNWDIEITNVTAGTPTGSAENAVAPDWDKLTASMEANLYDKGDAMEYDVTIENKGTIDAKLNDILTNLEQENSDAVIITFSGYAKGEILKAGSIKLIHVKIEYNPDYEGEETSSEVTIDFEYTQNNNETSPSEKMHLVNYDCTTNGGTSCTNYNEYLLEGSNINLSHSGSEKKYYNFVGWNTNKDATSGLTTLTMGLGDITLYAIYEEVDPTEPIIDSISTTATASSITVVVTAHDDESGIVKYEYSIDGGKTWIDRGSDNTYTFTGLTSDTAYTIDVRVTNGVEKTVTNNKTVTTSPLEKPTFSENTNGDVVISYPSGCTNGKTCSYSQNNGNNVTVTGSTTLSFGADGTVVATVTDGTNTVSSTYTFIKRNLYVSTSGSDTTGYGTIYRPYATLTKAYASATSSAEATIYVMDNITQTETTTMDDNKTIKIISYSSSDSVNSIIRSSTLTDNFIIISSGNITFEKITLDGNNVQTNRALIYINQKGVNVSLLFGATLQNNNRTSGWGGGLQVYTGESEVDPNTIVTIDGATITNNIGAGGGALDINGATLVMNSGTIANNKTANVNTLDCGGLSLANSNATINGGLISNNKGRHGSALMATNSDVVMTGGSISNNSGVRGAVAIWNGSSFTLDGGTIRNNTASADGGIWINTIEKPYGTYTYKSGVVCGNKPSNSNETSSTCPTS